MSNESSTKIIRILILFIVVVVITKNAIVAGLFTSKSHKGKGYFVRIPEGWRKVKKQKGFEYSQGVEGVMFVPKEMDPNIEEPDVYISIFTKKLTTPIWIEDEFPEILQSIKSSGFQLKDKGEVKLNDKVANWVVYYDKKIPALFLEFYMVTDNSIFYKMTYSALPEKFNVYRESFEYLKDSFKFRFSLY